MMTRTISGRAMSTRYVVRAVNDDDVILRPLVVQVDEKGCETGDIVGGWALNDWERAYRFAAELNDDESR